jgi:signal transduction histidine kinase
MRRLPLSTLLIGINVGLLLLAVTGVAFVAVRLLRQLADEQALARVEQAGTSARNAITHAGEEVSTTAQLLGERPTLLRLVQTNDTSALATFLTQFQQTSQLAGCSVILDNRVVAQSGLPLDGVAVWAAHRQEQNYFFHTTANQTALLLGAVAPIPNLPNAVVLVVIQLDSSFSTQISAEIGLPVNIVPATAAQAPGPLTALRTRALTTESAVTAYLTPPERYVTILSLRDSSAITSGLIETELSATAVTHSLQQLTRTFLLLALSVTALAALVSFLVGRQLGLPLQALTKSAARIGHGDLTTPILPAAGGEIGTLAATLEDMRRHLLELTVNLRQQQAESNAILTGIVEGVFTVDRERRIQYINPQAAAMLGRTAEGLVNQFCGDVLNPQGSGDGPHGGRPCEEQCPIIHARFRAGARATEHLLLSNGQRRAVVITSAPPLDDQPPANVLRQVQVMRDETEVEATRRLRDAVLANISHEFRTPLSAQLASIELLLDQLPRLTSEQIGALVRSLQRGTLRLTQLIDNLLESVRIEAGQYMIRHQPVALAGVIEQALEMTRPLLDQRQQQVILNLPALLPAISGDAPRLTQVFVNLLANANKFAPPGSAITLSGVVAAETITLWVEDQGPGLPEFPNQSLFMRFVRSADGEPEQSGVGLGLWIVKSIVERHGGRVEAQSSAAGTRLSVILLREANDENPGR